MLESMATIDSNGKAQSELDVGSRVRELRTQRGFSLRALGERLGISASALSQIETGRRRPSVARLHQIVSILDAPLSAVFDQGTTLLDPQQVPADLDSNIETVSIQRKREAADLTLEGGIHWLRLTATPIPGVDLLQVTYAPGSGSDEYLRHNGLETAHVLSGELSFDLGFEHHVISAGDSITYKSTTPHRITNPGGEIAVAIWLVLGSSSGSPEPGILRHHSAERSALRNQHEN
jgi:transcriptional regulator with XRE-family HTH domain